MSNDGPSHVPFGFLSQGLQLYFLIRYSLTTFEAPHKPPTNPEGTDSELGEPSKVVVSPTAVGPQLHRLGRPLSFRAHWWVKARLSQSEVRR